MTTERVAISEASGFAALKTLSLLLPVLTKADILHRTSGDESTLQWQIIISLSGRPYGMSTDIKLKAAGNTFETATKEAVNEIEEFLKIAGNPI